jgi:hypothetical protein
MGLSIESDIGHMAIHSGFGVGIPRNFRRSPVGADSICVDLAIFILLPQLPSTSMAERIHLQNPWSNNGLPDECCNSDRTCWMEQITSSG